MFFIITTLEINLQPPTLLLIMYKTIISADLALVASTTSLFDFAADDPSSSGTCFTYTPSLEICLSSGLEAGG